MRKFLPNRYDKRPTFNKWIKEHPEDKKMFESEYTVIRRRRKSLSPVPYAQEYQEIPKTSCTET